MKEKIKKNYYVAIKNEKKRNPNTLSMQQLVNLTRDKEKSRRTFAIFEIGERLNSELLEEDRESFVKGFEALLNPEQNDGHDAIFHSVMTLGKIMDEQLLEKEEQLYFKGMDYLGHAIGSNSEVVSTNAGLILQAKSEILNSL